MAALGLGLCPLSAAEEPDKYPIWWSPSLELESLDKIDERLGKEFPRSQWRVFSTGAAVNPGKTIVDNCNTLLAAREGSYHGHFHDQRDYTSHQHLNVACRTLGRLPWVNAAEESHLRDFVFTVAALDYLPADLRPEGRCAGVAPADQAIPWRQCDGFPLVDVIDEHKMIVWSQGRGVRLEILARGDFNWDDLDDLVIKTTKLPPKEWDGSIQDSVDVFVLMRAAPDRILRILE